MENKTILARLGGPSDAAHMIWRSARAAFLLDRYRQSSTLKSLVRIHRRQTCCLSLIISTSFPSSWSFTASRPPVLQGLVRLSRRQTVADGWRPRVWREYHDRPRCRVTFGYIRNGCGTQSCSRSSASFPQPHLPQ